MQPDAAHDPAAAAAVSPGLGEPGSGEVGSGRLGPAPLASASVIAALVAVPLGILFIPQVFAVALGGLSLARREGGGQRKAVGGIVGGLALTLLWALALGLLLKWWARSMAG